jgi:hypothetical protein
MSIIGLNVHSFDQRQHNENIKAIPSNSFDQRQNQIVQQSQKLQTPPQKPVISPNQHQPQNKQPSNKQ